MYFPRGKNKIQNRYLLKDTYDSYIESVKDNKLYKVDLKTYYNLLDEYLKELARQILENGYKFRMPFNLGNFFIAKIDIMDAKHRPIDWMNTVKYGKVIRHNNEHSDNSVYRFSWEFENKNIKHLFLYKFIPTRYNARRLAKITKSKEMDYFSIQDYGL
jgi:hypothetical protein